MRTRASLLVIGAGLLLTAPSLLNGLGMDDHFQRALAGGYAVVPRAPYDLYRFVPDDPHEQSVMMNRGTLPWFTSPRVRLAFFRPLSSLSVYLDYAVLPHWPWLFHLESLALYAGLIALVLALYRAVLPAKIAVLAGLMFAVDDAHGMAVGWLASRNALFAAAFGVAAVLLHDRARRQGSLPARVLAPLMLALALMSGEAGVSGFAYLFAYAVAFDPAPLRARALSLVPFLPVLVAWRLMSRSLDFGVHGSGFYVDPAEAPLQFLVTFPGRLLANFAAQFALPFGDVWFIWGSLAWPIQVVLVLLGLSAAAAFGWLIAPALRADRACRFLALGTFLSMCLATATLPSDKNLLLAGVGAFGLIARVIGTLTGGEPTHSRAARWMRRGLISIHLVLAPLILPISSSGAGLADRFLRGTMAALDRDPALAQQTLVLMNLPNLIIGAFYWATPSAPGALTPARLRSLSTSEIVEVVRESDRALRITMVRTFLTDPTLALVRAPADRFVVGERKVLPPITFEVLRLDAQGRLAELRCEFDVPLDDPSLRWVTWTGDGYAEFHPPALGERVRVPAQ